ncbi:hypothetical protein [Bacillus sp. FJAT-47783]|uniref:hypothetical protein n=1 Tax=Bacillus sp. FJAT-47783 TaxID=2922712 RepID=UPI001FAB4F22|nr:hypothetical protein [Bacillus sp. FJAT-47783]
MPKKKYEKELPNNSGSISVEAWSDVFSAVKISDSAKEYSDEIVKGDVQNDRSSMVENDQERF